MNEQHLLFLEVRARELVSACQAMDTYFANGTEMLAREGDARRLETFAVNFAKHLDEEERRESVKDRTEVVIGNLQAKHARRKRYLGTIVIRVGDGGLPNDVTIVPVSRLASTQNRDESEVILELQRQGGLLFPPETFRRMIGILIDGLRTGKLQLPISLKQLPAKWAIPGKVTVGFTVSVQPLATVSYQIMVVPQLPPGKNTSTQM